MLQAYNDQSEAFYDNGSGSQSLDLGHYFAILKRRALYFILPFTLALLLGAFVTSIQRPVYEAKGKILVESQEIPSDLVRSTVMDTANERIQVIQQRIMTRDNLLALVNKYGLFGRERQWLSATELLDKMRDRTKFELVDINSNSQGRTGPSTIAFTVSFEDENPAATSKVVNDFLTLILSEDARNRTNRATETTNFLAHESERLSGELAAVEAKIAETRLKPTDNSAATMDPGKLQVVELTRLKEELAQKRATYSDQYPGVKALEKKVAAMEELVAKTPSPVANADSGLVELERQAIATEKSLEEANRKLEEARLGERLERDQQSERLEVIEQPVEPQKPIKPNRVKLLALSFALALAVGLGAVIAAETLDASIRHSHQLVGVANGRMIVSIPYIATRAETSRRKGRLVLLAGGVGVLLVAGLVGFLFFGPPIDLSWVNQFWVDKLTSLSK